MLVAMAAVAERAGGRPFAVRWLVLLILGRAEAVAWVLVVEVTRAAWPRFEKPFEGGSSASDAARLATRLRALGLALGASLRQAHRCNGFRMGRAPRRFPPIFRRLFATPGSRPAPHDTS